MLAALLLFELVFLPEAIPGTPCFRNLHTFRDAMFQLPVSPTTITGDFFLTTRKGFAAVRYPAVWFASLAFAVPFGCVWFPFSFNGPTLTRALPPDIAISISNLFPVVYGTLYDFSPSTQGLLYLPMLIGSVLAEFGTGQVGDKCVAADLSSPLGVLIGKRNADYATGTKASEVENPTSVSTVRHPEGASKSDSTRVPEMRLVIGLVGILICIVGDRHARSSSPVDAYSTASIRPVFCGSASQLTGTSTGQILRLRVVSRRTVPKW